MKPSHILLLLFVCVLIVVVARPKDRVRQAQQEEPMMEMVNSGTFRIHYHPETDEQKNVADILWFKRAAQSAMEMGTPGFNVLEQRMTDEGVEGLIQLEKDPMKAEYDANEILSLQIVDEEN